MIKAYILKTNFIQNRKVKYLVSQNKNYVFINLVEYT